jgi:NAD(P)H dehydrogenase (quinone)
MNHLILFCHPHDKSFNANILQQYKDTLEKQNHAVNVRNLYELNFNPVLSEEEYKGFLQLSYSEEIQKEHDYIRCSDFITFIFPFWWTGFPAMLKGYVDRVFSYGFAYRMENGVPIPLLHGKKANTIFTLGTPKEVYQESGIVESIEKIMNISIFEFCGIQLHQHLHFGGLDLSCHYDRLLMLEQVKQLAQSS